MTKQDLQDLTSMLTALAEMYGKPKLSDFVVSLWCKAMQGYSIEAIRAAFSAHVQNPDNGQFMPKPADIIRLIGGTNQDKAMIAWAKVDKAVRLIGTYADVVFDDPLIHAVVTDMGGWIALGQKNDDEWPFIAKEFETRYRSYAMRQETPLCQPVLTGIANAHNSRNGYQLSAPVLIGDEQKAQALLSGGKKENPVLKFKRLTA